MSAGHSSGHGSAGAEHATADWQLTHFALAGGTLVVLVLLLAMAHDGDTKTTSKGPNWFCEIILAVVFVIVTITATVLSFMTTQSIVGYYLLIIGLIMGSILWIVDVILLIVAGVK